ncbi:MAG: zinc ribbon domain-containing protein [Pyrinomonadaceae bacterium]|nr:zinc ribbon domain-containing protein [Pyrinomonadaceae bacterium]
MPIYEYTCQKCQAQIEIMQKISDLPLKRHSECGGKLEKQWSQTSFQLKGAGWYVTDYATKKSEDKEKDGKEKPEAKDGTEAKDVKEAKDGKGDAVAPAAATTPQAGEGPQKSPAKKTIKKAPSGGGSGGD